VAWQGQLIFGSNGIDLGKDNITYPSNGYDDLGLNVQTHEPAGKFQLEHFAPGGGIAMWAGSNAPSRQDCVDDLNASENTFAVTEIGDLVCVKGQNYQVAVARIIAVDTTKNQVTAKLVLWTQPMQ
jgi:hypothetical protein